ncbi:DUF2190 family protein [Xanthomonas citri pv. glycines]|uniref:structural cement protein Gp24 n=1 Tax=Xanthomonas citri TaxID=346 RepID=UPI000301A75B|nr:DUF2190 family protein [Xanthomonas citri]ARV23326.1 hypothetical protein A9D66_12140 [Xanthomonas citri pv. glycines str. 12-2]WLA18085.1 DUF2190 family protein [Xanthomonas citri pv. glycines]
MALQTNYPDVQPPATLGMQATMLPATIISRNVEDVAGLAFGRAVAQGAAEKGIVAFGGANLKYVGITLLDRSATGLDLFPQRSSARVITKGDIWVTASVAVAAGDPVYLTAAGAFTNVATNNTAITGARWDTSTTAAAQLAVVRLG